METPDLMIEVLRVELGPVEDARPVAASLASKPPLTCRKLNVRRRELLLFERPFSGWNNFEAVIRNRRTALDRQPVRPVGQP